MSINSLITLSKRLLASSNKSHQQIKSFLLKNKIFKNNALVPYFGEVFLKHDIQLRFLCTLGNDRSGLRKDQRFLHNHELDLKLSFDLFVKKFMKSCFGKDALDLFAKKSSENSDSGSSKGKENKTENEPENDDKNQGPAKTVMLFWVAFIMYLLATMSSPDESLKSISWNEFFYDMLSKGEVEKIIVRPELEAVYVKLHPNAVIKGAMVREGMYVLKIGEFEKLEEKLRKAEKDLGIPADQSVPVIYQRGLTWMPKLLGLVAILAFLWFLKKSVKIQLPNPSEMFARERKANFIRVDQQTKEGKGITFKDVAGLHEAKIEVMEFVDYLKNSGNYKKLGAKIPKGALLLGPPGCGKTLLAKAVATEAKVPFLAMAGSEFVEMLGGLGAARVRDLFKEARQNSPCIIYIDEIDAIGRKRSGDNWSQSTEEEHTLNQLLVEMDGIGTKEGVIIIASTNRSEVLDKALLRAGRFDRHILIDLPTLKERVELFDMYLKKLKLKQPPSSYSENLAQLSPGMSGADISNICNEAALHAARTGASSVDASNFDYAVERVVAGVAKKSRILSQQEKKIVAYHEAGHALVGWLLEHTDCLMRVSIVPRTNHMLGFAQYLPQDKKLQSTNALFDQMCLLLGGRVAESLTFNAVTTGAQDDLKKVTKLAYDQIKHMGMNENVGLVSYPSQSDFAIKPYSKATAKLIDQEVNMLVAKVYKFTEKLLMLNKEKLRVIADALLEKEALSYRDMEQLIGPPPFGKKNFLGATDAKN